MVQVLKKTQVGGIRKKARPVEVTTSSLQGNVKEEWWCQLHCLGEHWHMLAYLPSPLLRGVTVNAGDSSGQTF